MGEVTIRARLAHELREYAVTAAYLWLTLGALLLLEAGLKSEAGVGGWHAGLALGKALVLGKFLVIGEAARLGARRDSRTLLSLIARKVLVFVALLLGLSVVEEFAVGWLHGTPAAATLAAYEARSLLELFATCLLVLLVIAPFVAAKEIDRNLEPGGLRRVLREPPRSALGDERGKEPR